MNWNEQHTTRNGICGVRISDNVLDPKDWGVDMLTIKEGYVVRQVNAYKGCFRMPDMLGWSLTDLHNWSSFDSTGSHPEIFHEVRIIDSF